MVSRPSLGLGASVLDLIPYDSYLIGQALKQEFSALVRCVPGGLDLIALKGT